jgi:hypothetical protein
MRNSTGSATGSSCVNRSGKTFRAATAFSRRTQRRPPQAQRFLFVIAFATQAFRRLKKIITQSASLAAKGLYLAPATCQQNVWTVFCCEKIVYISYTHFLTLISLV